MGSNGNVSQAIEQIMQDYRDGTHPSRYSAMKVAEACSKVLERSKVLHEISHSTIESTRVEGELVMREMVRRGPVRQRGEIENDVVDLAKVSIGLHLPAEKTRVRQLIEERFTVFLTKWAAMVGWQGNVGDVQLLWELLTLLNLTEPRALRRILDGLDVSNVSESDYAERARRFRPLRLSLALYVADSIIRLPQGLGRLQQTENFWVAEPKAERQRYEMEVIRDSIILLTDLCLWGEGAAEVLLGDLEKSLQGSQQDRIKWLDKHNTKRAFDNRWQLLCGIDAKNLQWLWRLLEENERLPAQFVFSLARLRVKGHTAPSWHAFRKAILDLVYV
ncbi:hypothetical protein BJY04DRAFT_212812 [Aspergillus karnatakaensis]|uniref:uncharacterized protein n=1 Tax=Aspergillus karnatakaensis TaxID=1810916 RepID=UPI003CCD0102